MFEHSEVLVNAVTGEVKSVLAALSEFAVFPKETSTEYRPDNDGRREPEVPRIPAGNDCDAGITLHPSDQK